MGSHVWQSLRRSCSQSRMKLKKAKQKNSIINSFTRLSQVEDIYQIWKLDFSSSCLGAASRRLMAQTIETANLRWKKSSTGAPLTRSRA